MIRTKIHLMIELRLKFSVLFLFEIISNRTSKQKKKQEVNFIKKHGVDQM